MSLEEMLVLTPSSSEAPVLKDDGDGTILLCFMLSMVRRSLPAAAIVVVAADGSIW